MPSRNKKQKGKSSPKGRGRATRKTQRGQSRKQVLQVPGGQFYTDAEHVQLKFTDSYFMVQSASGGALNNLIYKINSLFQVNQTAAAGTPQGIAELQTKFKRYHVLGSRIHWRIRGLHPGGNFGALGVLGVAPTTSNMMSAVLYPLPTAGIGSTTIAGAAVQKYASKRHDWPRDIAPAAGTPEASIVNPATLWVGSHSMRSAKLDADPDPKQVGYTALFGADPANLQLWIFALADPSADATAKKPFFVEVELTYDVYAYERITVTDALLDCGPKLVIASACAEEKKAPPPRLSDVVHIDDDDVSPPSVHSLPGGYELVKRKSLGVLSARRP